MIYGPECGTVWATTPQAYMIQDAVDANFTQRFKQLNKLKAQLPRNAYRCQIRHHILAVCCCQRHITYDCF